MLRAPPCWRQAGEDAKLAAEAQEKIALDDYNVDPAVLAVRELAAAPDGYNPKKVTSKLKQLGFEDHPAKRARLVYLVSLLCDKQSTRVHHNSAPCRPHLAVWHQPALSSACPVIGLLTYTCCGASPVVQCARISRLYARAVLASKSCAAVRSHVVDGRMSSGRVCVQALFGNLGTHKLGPQIEAHAEVLQAEAGEDTTKQVHGRCLFGSPPFPWLVLLSVGGVCQFSCPQFGRCPISRHCVFISCPNTCDTADVTATRTTRWSCSPAACRL